MAKEWLLARGAHLLPYVVWLLSVAAGLFLLAYLVIPAVRVLLLVAPLLLVGVYWNASLFDAVVMASYALIGLVWFIVVMVSLPYFVDCPTRGKLLRRFARVLGAEIAVGVIAVLLQKVLPLLL